MWVAKHSMADGYVCINCIMRSFSFPTSVPRESYFARETPKISSPIADCKTGAIVFHNLTLQNRYFSEALSSVFGFFRRQCLQSSWFSSQIFADTNSVQLGLVLIESGEYFEDRFFYKAYSWQFAALYYNIFYLLEVDLKKITLVLLYWPVQPSEFSETDFAPFHSSRFQPKHYLLFPILIFLIRVFRAIFVVSSWTCYGFFSKLAAFHY